MAWQGKRALRQGSTGAARVGEGPQPEAPQGPPVTTHPCRPGLTQGQGSLARPILAALAAQNPTPLGQGQVGQSVGCSPGPALSCRRGLAAQHEAHADMRQHTRARRRPCSPEQLPSLQNPGPCPRPRLVPVLAAPLAFSVAFEEKKPRGPLSGGNPALNRRPEGPAPWTAGFRANEQPTEPPQATQTPGEAEPPGPNCPPRRALGAPLSADGPPRTAGCRGPGCRRCSAPAMPRFPGHARGRGDHSSAHRAPAWATALQLPRQVSSGQAACLLGDPGPQLLPVTQLWL